MHLPHAALVGALVLTNVGVARADGRRAMPAARPRRVDASELVGAAAPSAALHMSLTLQLQHRDELDALITAQQHPGTPEYHRWLSPEEFAARFAPPAETYTALADWLRNEGFTVHTWLQRTRIDFSGAVHQVEGAFGVRMHQYRHRERLTLANDTAPLLPERFAGVVRALRLHSFRFAEPVVRITERNLVTDTMGPQDIYTAYNLGGVLQRGIDGSGQTIAVVARSDFNVGDVLSFQEQFGVPTRAPTKVFPATNPGIGAPNGACAGYRDPVARQECMDDEEAEVLLDVQWASALAPGATILVDISDADIDASLLDVVTHHPEAKIISISFGSCERLDPTAVDALDPMYVQAAAQGQTVVVAAGNDGADGCQDGLGPSVNALASPIHVTAVGGTALNPGFDASGVATGHTTEITWNDDVGASGGGVSTLVRKPAYQSGPGVPTDGFRDQPDVAFMASPTTAGYVIVMEGEVMIVGGTSVATPSWGGIVALLNHATGRDGSGAINEALYTLARDQQNAGGLPVFFDITTGNNTFNRVSGFSAAQGFDLATGWGTPNVVTLVRAFTATTCAGDCNADGAITVDELLTAVNLALGATPETQCPSADSSGDGQVTVDEIIQALHHALDGC